MTLRWFHNPAQHHRHRRMYPPLPNGGVRAGCVCVTLIEETNEEDARPCVFLGVVRGSTTRHGCFTQTKSGRTNSRFSICGIVQTCAPVQDQTTKSDTIRGQEYCSIGTVRGGKHAIGGTEMLVLVDRTAIIKQR